MMYSYRIVAIGDIHVELNLLNLAFEWISKNSIDAVIQTGDICNARLLPKDANLAQILNQADSTFDIFKSSNKLINFVPGNHDPIEIGSKYVSDTIINRHSNSGYLFNYKITGIGGSHSVPSQLIGKTVPFIESSLDHIYDLADLDYVGKRIIDDFEYYIHSDIIKNYDYLFPCDILITHTPALIEGADYHNYASLGIYKLIERYQPLLHISGHIHLPKTHIEKIEWENKKATTLINLGSLDEKKIFLIELSKNEIKVDEVSVIELE